MPVTLNANSSTGFIATSDTSGVLQLQTGGTTAVTVDASQNVGIGTASPVLKLDVSGKVKFTGVEIAVSEDYTTNLYYSGGWKYRATGYGTTIGASSGAITFNNTASSGTADAAATLSERMRIDSSGNVGIGGAPSYKLHVYGTEYASVVETTSSTDGTAIRFAIKSPVTQGQLELDWNNDSTRTGGGYGMIQVGKTNNSPDLALIAGKLLMATTTFASGQNGVLIRGSSGGYTDEVLQTRTAGTASTSATGFYNNNGRVGTISTSGTATAYNTSSDYRLKNSIAPITSALDKVTQLKPCTYKWNADGSEGQGFIAHELAEIVPQCVHGEKDAVDAEGNPVYQGIDTSFLVATLTAAIQEQQALITQLQADVAALKGASA